LDFASRPRGLACPRALTGGASAIEKEVLEIPDVVIHVDIGRRRRGRSSGVVTGDPPADWANSFKHHRMGA
jgi:hypothetical protein